MKDDLPVIAFPSQDDWRAWLDEQHATSEGLWLKVAKKDTGIATVTYDEALDVALCYGWIDGQRNRFDDTWFLQRFTPRRARSKWSQRNCAKVATLTDQGLMRPAGLREVDRAKADGRWDAAYPSQRDLVVPDDLQAALAADGAAREFFDALDRTNRYAILYRLHDAKKPETRARRIETFVAMLAEGKKLHP
ncbi:MAG: hypothetical protein QOD63_2851 [Actinomycetota bacterium]|nr:hypothetical protein [Actinomycetota bacterium]